jgi:tetrapyrrole methylase family protein/MazG family protein
MSTREAFARLVEIMHILRAECPWDRKQTHESLRPYLLEEAYEVLQALDSGDHEALREELGDLMLQVVFHAEVAAEREDFTIEEVLHTICEKLVRRHPHVFAAAEAETPDEVVQHWEKAKRAEREKKSALDGVPRELPGLLRASRTLSKIRQTGVDPFIARDALSDLRVWTERLESAIEREDRETIEGAVGMLCMAACEVASDAHVNPEDALRGRIQRLAAAFRREESSVLDRNRHFNDLTGAERRAISERLLEECEEEPT